MKTIDFYTNFEGEPEIVLTCLDSNGQVVERLHFWDGYFNEIVDLIPPGANGEWEGIPRQYHLVTGWYRDVTWEEHNCPLFLEQLQRIDTSKFELRSIPP